MQVVPFPQEAEGRYFILDHDAGFFHDFIPPRSSFVSRAAGAAIYDRLTDLHRVRDIRSIAPSAVIYVVQTEREGAFPAGLYRVSLLCRSGPKFTQGTRTKNHAIMLTPLPILLLLSWAPVCIILMPYTMQLKIYKCHIHNNSGEESTKILHPIPVCSCFLRFCPHCLQSCCSCHGFLHASL